MQLLTRIDQRLTLPGESETRNSQRRLALVLLLIASFANIFLILHLFNIGLPGTALSYLVLTATFLIAFVLGLIFPAQYTLLNGLCMIAILISNVAANYYAGGYVSGFEFFIWVLTVPVWLALFAGRREMILPAPIAARLKLSPETIADGYDDVTVLFADIVDFTAMSSKADPVAVVQKLNEIFSDFDVLAARYGLEKIKTIGDAYMVAGGPPQPRADHCQAVAAFAVELVASMARHSAWTGQPLRIRVGINCGPVVAGVIGRQKFIYDLWGDAVNVASRMESYGLSNEIQVTEAVKERLADLYEFEERGPIQIKGKGQMKTYLLHPARAAVPAPH